MSKSYNEVKGTIPEHVQLVAVSKTKPNEDIQALYGLGQRIFGENKVQELVTKYEELPKDIHWHFIGHLQTNKVKYIAPFVNLLHGVDSLKLLVEVNKQASKNSRVINCLLQFHIAKEESKFGLSIDHAVELLESDMYKGMQNISIIGVMGMATYSVDEQLVKTEFKKLKEIFEKLKLTYFKDDTNFKEISMGMSGDYHLAIEEGSTMVRIGSLLFGARNYSK